MHGRTTRRPRPVAGPIERVGTDDLMQLATDVGPVRAQLGMVLLLAARPGATGGPDATTGEAARIARAVADSLRSIPRFRQRLRRVPLGCGRPIWVDDPDFAAHRHVRVVACPPPGEQGDLLRAAVAAVTEPLPMSAPLWRAVVVTGLEATATGLVLVCHHVLLDGVGGLAVLERLVSRDEPDRHRAARPAPKTRDLALDAALARLHALARLPRTLPLLRAQVASLRHSWPTPLPRTSLNRPTGPQRRVVVARIALDDVRTAAHAHHATINDVILAAVAGALRGLLARRGESSPRLVASVPVARRGSTTTDELGNRVGGMLVPLDTSADRAARLRRTAAITRARKTEPGGDLIAPLMRLVRGVGLMRRNLDEQRVVSTFVSDLHGPEQPLRFVGHHVVEILPITHTTGNVTASFASLSYAGTLVVTVTVDPDACPDADDLAALLQRELEAYGAGALAASGPDEARVGAA